jgi:hypothetical protein
MTRSALTLGLAILVAILSVGCGDTPTSPMNEVPLFSSYQLEVRFAASCIDPSSSAPSVFQVALTRTTETTGAQTFAKWGFLGTNTSEFAIRLNGSGHVTGTVFGAAYAQDQQNNWGVLFAADYPATVATIGSGTPNSGYALTVSGSMSFCSYQALKGCTPQTTATCAASTATLNPVSP